MIIDLHTHISIPGMNKFARMLDRKPFGVKTLLKRMDMEGIDKSVLLPLINPENLDFYAVAGNHDCIKAAKKYPDRLYTFCNIDPRSIFNLPRPGKNIGKLIRAYKEMGCIGIGEICAGLPVNHRLFKELYHYAELENMPMIFHFVSRSNVFYGVTDNLHLPFLEECLKEFPRAIFIGHSPCFWNEIDGKLKEAERDSYVKGPLVEKGSLWKLMELYPNLYCDTSAGSAYHAMNRDPENAFQFIEKFNEKIFFGTDRFSSVDESIPPILIFLNNALRDGSLSRKAYDNIMYRNFNRIFQI